MSTSFRSRRVSAGVYEVSTARDPRTARVIRNENLDANSGQWYAASGWDSYLVSEPQFTKADAMRLAEQFLREAGALQSAAELVAEAMADRLGAEGFEVSVTVDALEDGSVTTCLVAKGEGWEPVQVSALWNSHGSGAARFVGGGLGHGKVGTGRFGGNWRVVETAREFEAAVREAETRLLARCEFCHDSATVYTLDSFLNVYLPHCEAHRPDMNPEFAPLF